MNTKIETIIERIERNMYNNDDTKLLRDIMFTCNVSLSRAHVIMRDAKAKAKYYV